MEYAWAFTFLTAFELHNNDGMTLINVPILLISELSIQREKFGQDHVTSNG